MKATTALVTLMVMGVLLQSAGYNTLGGEIVNKLSPNKADYASMIVVTGGSLLAFGMLMLSSSLPTKALAAFMLGLITMPVQILSDKSLAFPNEIQMIFGIVWIGLMIQAVVGALGGDV